MIIKNNPLRYKYESFEFGEIDIHLKSLKDKNQFSDKENQAQDLGISSALWSIFGVVWESSIVLAHEVLNYNIKGIKFLDVGCGIAISSHLLNARGADITATDYHPEVGNFLKTNVELNNAKEIPFVLEDWNTKESKLGRFDLMIGGDLLYEVPQVELLSNFLQAHANPKCEIIIVDPNRGHANKFTRAMEAFGFSHNKTKSSHIENFKGNIHRYLRE